MLLAAAALAATSPLAPAAEAPTLAFDFDFTANEQGWEGFFADHPPGVEQTWGIAAGLRPLPAELGLAGSGFMLSGNNHSDDLAMLLKRRLTAADGIVPGQTYWVDFEIQFASNAPSGAPGVGGSPGDSVYLKAGASAVEPGTVLEAATAHLRPTVNVGFQSVGGPAASPVGVIANGRDAAAPAQYVSLQRTHRHRFPVRAAADGSLWLLVMTDSAFEGPTTLYYQRIRAVLTPVAAPAGELVNLSSRARVQSGEAVMIAGFFVAGSAPGTYLVRGVGPTLADYDVEQELADPRLTLHDGDGAPVVANDDWSTSPDADQLRETAARHGAFPLREGSKDAALRVELAPGSYTAVLEGQGQGAGVGLVEIYAASTGAIPPRLVNLSTRARVATGENGIFAGFYVRGPGPAEVLVRAVGPTLAGQGIAEPATDPTLTLYAGEEMIAFNDDWQSVNPADLITDAAARTGAFALPPTSRDAALLVTLAPGLYSVVVEEGGATDGGVALVELYAVP